MESSSYKNEYIYDNSGLLLISAEYSWSWYDNDWQGTKKWEEAFDNENFILYHADYNWDQNNKSWLISEKEFYYWSNHIVTTPSVSENKFCIISPNPSDGLFKIELNEPVDCLLDVYTTDGRKVYSTTISGIEMSIDLTELNPGLYFVILTSEKKRSTNKIIID